MKTLTLLRHAKSDWDDPAQADFDRPLNARGRDAALAMGREMRALGLTYDHVLASPARRVTETLERVGESCDLAPVFVADIYLAATDTLLALVRAAPDDAKSLLLVGHNPGMERLTLLLSRGGPLHDTVAEKYPTGALAQLAFPIDHWRDIAESGATLERFLRPRDISQ